MPGVAPKNKLYKALSIECGIADANSSMRFYYGFVRYVLKELKETGRIQLPEFGVFEIVEDKGRRMHGLKTGNIIKIPPVKRLAFRPARKLKDHIKKRF